jgi:hypothetical protein
MQAFHLGGLKILYNMFRKLSSLLATAVAGRQVAADKLECFHCGEMVKRRRAVFMQFDGASRALCCHGCAAILKTVEELGMCSEYYSSKTRDSGQNEE